MTDQSKPKSSRPPNLRSDAAMHKLFSEVDEALSTLAQRSNEFEVLPIYSLEVMTDLTARYITQRALLTGLVPDDELSSTALSLVSAQGSTGERIAEAIDDLSYALNDVSLLKARAAAFAGQPASSDSLESAASLEDLELDLDLDEFSSSVADIASLLQEGSSPFRIAAELDAFSARYSGTVDSPRLAALLRVLLQRLDDR